jgi:hypothetical protein
MFNSAPGHPFHSPQFTPVAVLDPSIGGQLIILYAMIFTLFAVAKGLRRKIRMRCLVACAVMAFLQVEINRYTLAWMDQPREGDAEISISAAKFVIVSPIYGLIIGILITIIFYTIKFILSKKEGSGRSKFPC